jgi:ATPase family associated with various cellular activities (AAA)
MANAKPDGDERSVKLDFQELERLRLFSSEILRTQLVSLRYFAHAYGFKHLETSGHVSVASSATCVLSLVATNVWQERWTSADSRRLLKFLASQDTSADLDANNAFTIAWILDAVTELEACSGPLENAEKRMVERKDATLQDIVRDCKGGVKIDPYPPSAYLTQLVVRVLQKRRRLTLNLRTAVTNWAWAELPRQLTLIQSQSKTADAFAVAYLVMLVATVTPTTKVSPEQTSIQRTALRTFFDCQGADGTWPLSRPLFHYPQVGNAYCYDYEMLTQLLQQEELHDMLLEYLAQLRSAAEAAPNTVYRVEGNVRTWTSGHHPQKGGPESWATASVYHFFHCLDRLLAKAVRIECFRYLEEQLPTTRVRGKRKSEFAKDLLDSRVRVKEQGKFRHRFLKSFLWDRFVKPLWEQSQDIAKGRPFRKKTPTSAIFYGPPGTSKTELCQQIADFLGWPLLAIDPSHLLRNGMDGIQAEANHIFRMLEQTEEVVVLFDEFDELVLERGSPKAEKFSRFLTTAMLPKLASIHKRATLVFIIATNNISDFDIAIRRQGRFDRVIQIMPPTFDAKMTKIDWGLSKIDLARTLRKLKVELSSEVKQKIGALTFGECDDFATDLAMAKGKKSALSILEDHCSRCTLNTSVPREKVPKTWSQRCEEEALYTR